MRNRCGYLSSLANTGEIAPAEIWRRPIPGLPASGETAWVTVEHTIPTTPFIFKSPVTCLTKFPSASVTRLWLHVSVFAGISSNL